MNSVNQANPEVPHAPEVRAATRVPAEPGVAVVAAAPDPVPVLDMPADGVPDVVADERRLVVAAEALGKGEGPMAVDAERASGYRYGQRAYLVQLRRAGAGTWLVDPVACPDLSPLKEATAGVEWVLHAANQDLPCLAEVGMAPTALVDTELGARLAGLPRVGLSAVTEHYLGVSLAKEHSAVDWSSRPLPEPWLRYAALDVEILVQLRDALLADLEAQGKAEWARQEFAALVEFTKPVPRADPWRRTSGIHRVRNRRSLAVVRELWYLRDDLARARDISPGRVIPDAMLLEVALAAPANGDELAKVTTNRAVRRYAGQLLDAVRRAANLPETALPTATLPAEGPPPARVWADRDPVAAARLRAVRAALGEFAEGHRVPVENVLSPDTLRRVLWEPPEPDHDAVAAQLAARGARPWQIEVAAPLIADALAGDN